MRVLFVNENIGGHSTVHLNLERALHAHSDVTPEFVHVPPPGLLRRIAGARIPGLARLDLDFQALRAQLAWSWYVRRALRRRAGNYDVLHIYTQNAALLSVAALRRSPSVVSTDSTNDLNAYRLPQRRATWFTTKLLPITRAIERRVYKATTLVVPNSGFVAASMRTAYGVPAERMRIVPMGVPMAPDVPRREGRAKPVLTFVGRHFERKGGVRLLNLFREHLADRCTLELVTHDEVPPTPGVRVHDDLEPGDPRLDEILGRTDVFVFPSPMDQSPNAVLEAMAMGLPVVALRVGALPEMVEHGVTGLVVASDDDGALLEAIDTLVRDDALRATMGAAARQRAQERYDVAQQTSRLIDVLDEARRLHDKR